MSKSKSEYLKEYYFKHRDQLKASHREYYFNNREKILKKRKKYYEKNKPKKKQT